MITEKMFLSRHKEMEFKAQKKELDLGSCRDTSAIIRLKAEYMSADEVWILI